MKIIKIGAVWCPGCLVMHKVWREITQNNSITIEELDYDMDSLEVSKYNVGQVLPVIIFLDEQNYELTRLIGEQSTITIQEIINKYRS